MNRIEQVRAKLEEVESHVTFVKENKEYNNTVWYVGENMEKVTISNDIDVNEIPANRVMKKILVNLELL